MEFARGNLSVDIQIILTGTLESWVQTRGIIELPTDQTHRALLQAKLQNLRESLTTTDQDLPMTQYKAAMLWGTIKHGRLDIANLLPQLRDVLPLIEYQAAIIAILYVDHLCSPKGFEELQR